MPLPSQTATVPVALEPATDASVIRVAVVDSHLVFRAALHSFLAADPDLDLVAEAPDAAHVLPLLAAVRADILILDLASIQGDSLATLNLLFSRIPARRIILMHTDHPVPFFGQALQLNLCALIDKQVVPDRLVPLIRRVCLARQHS